MLNLFQHLLDVFCDVLSGDPETSLGMTVWLFVFCCILYWNVQECDATDAS